MSASPEQPQAANDPLAAPLDSRDADAFARAFNDLLVSTFNSIEEYEEQALCSFEGLSISTAEAHVIDAVGRGCYHNPAGCTVTRVATTLGIRVPSATTAVNRLVAKGFLAKERSGSDARAVHVKLTQSGRRAYRLHALFHRRMVDAVAGDMTAAERATLARGVQKLQQYFIDAAAAGHETNWDAHRSTSASA